MGEQELLTLTDDQISVVRLDSATRGKTMYEADPDSDGTDGGGDSDGTDGAGDSDGTDSEPDSDGTD
jgi:hypothetical protein